MSNSLPGTTHRIGRRALLGGGAAGAVSLMTAALGAQQSPAATAPATGPATGPVVFLDYDQAGLDAAYNQDVWAANAQLVRDRWAANSAYARKYVGEPMHVAYGPTAIETLDIYRTPQANAPIHVFVHGGAWQRGLAKDSAFAAESLVRAGAHLVVPDFAWVQDVGGSLLTMADQVKRALVWVYRNASTFGGDPNRIYISGHSSGGHLAAVALTTDWTTVGLPRNLLKGGLCCSGLFDLKGARLSSRRDYVRFDDETEVSLSPIRHLAHVSCPIAIVHASRDSPEFQRLSRDFAEALQRHGHHATLTIGDAYNHFELIETLANPYGIVGRLVLEQMHLAVG